MVKPGPGAGSEGAKRVSEAHRGSHSHDQQGGFASNPELARDAGKKGGEVVKRRYGSDYYKDIGRKGGETLKRERGREFFAEIGRKGGEMRGTKKNKLVFPQTHVDSEKSRGSDKSPEPKDKKS
jgi:general stress protein YciG